MNYLIILLKGGLCVACIEDAVNSEERKDTEGQENLNKKWDWKENESTLRYETRDLS